MKFKKNISGFTLVETLISILILAIVLAGGLSLYFNSSAISALMTHKKFATELTSKIMEELKKNGYASLPLPGPGIPTALTTADDPSHIILDLTPATKTVTVTDIGSPVEYKQVDVIVNWTEAGKSTPRSAQATTYIAP